MMTSSVRFGAIIPLAGDHRHAHDVAVAVEKAAQAKGLNTAIVSGPQEFGDYDPVTQTFGGTASYTVYTGKDADNYKAFKAAEQKAVDEHGRLLNKQIRELGFPPDNDALSDDAFWKAEADHEKRQMVWDIFNPHSRIPSISDFHLPPEGQSIFDFQDAKSVEDQLKAGTLDISG